MVKKSRYTDEALSRILSEHAGTNLIRSGSTGWHYGGCINQAAFNEPLCGKAKGLYGRRAEHVAEWFDRKYEHTLTPEALLRKIAEHEEA